MTEISQSVDISHKRLLERISDAFYAVSNDWVITYWNQQMADRTGKPAQEVVGQTLWNVFPELNNHDLEDRYREAMQQKKPVSFEMYLEVPFDYWVEIDVYPDEDGLSIFSREITERKKLERKQQQAEYMFQHTHDAVFLIKVEEDSFRFERVNPAYENFTRLSSDELTGRTIRDVFGSEDAQAIRKRYKKCIRRGEPIEYVEQLDVPEENSYWETRISPFEKEGGVEQILGSTRDITDRKEREQTLENIKQRLELIIDAANLGTWDWSIETGDLVFNDQWANMLGYDKDELKPHFETWEDLLHPDDRESVNQALDAHLMDGLDLYDEEIRLRTSDGDWKWVRTVGRVVERDDQGDPVRATGIHIDISEQKSMERQLRQSNQTLQEIVSTQEMVSESIQDRERLFSEVANYVQKLTHSDGAAIEINEDDQMEYKAASGIVADNVGMRLDIDKSLSGLSYRDAEMKRCDDVDTDDRVVEAELAKKIGIRSMLMIPLQYRDEQFGALKVVYSEPDGFGDTEEWVLSLMGGLLSSAIWQSRQYERLETHAKKDKLTGLNNRREFLNRLEKEVERSRRYDNNLTLAILDIDHFKAINDSHGHPAGDQVLQSLSDILGEETRNTDIVGRYGGEEFSILLPETSLPRAYKLAKRLRRTIADRSFEIDGGELHMTVSIGLSAFYQEIDDPDTVTKQADNALYVAKDKGRDRVERRTQQRQNITDCSVSIITHDNDFEGEIEDMSPRGLCVRIDDTISDVDIVQVESKGNLADDAEFPRTAKIRWRRIVDGEETLLGLELIES